MKKAIPLQPEGDPLTELLVTKLLPEQIKLLENYQIFVEPVWIEETLYNNLLLPDGSVSRKDPSQGPDIWIMVLPGGMQVSYYRLDQQPYAVLKGNA